MRARLPRQVVVGIPYYTERDNVISQLVTLRQARHALLRCS